MRSFFINKVFLGVMLTCSVSLFSEKKMTLSEVEANIESLKNEQLRYEKDANFFESEAQRMQFIQSELPLSKKYYKLATRDREISAEIQKEIDRQEKYRQKLLRGEIE